MSYTTDLTSPLDDSTPLGGHYAPPSFFFDLPRGDDYYSTIKRLLLDDQVVSALDLRKRRALAFPWKWDDNSDKEATDLLDALFADLTFSHDMEDGLGAIEYGFMPCEVVWQLVDGLWRFAKIEQRSPEKFRIDSLGRLQYQSPDGLKPVPARKVIAFTHKATRENPYGQSVLSAVYPHYQSKWETMDQIQRLGDKYSVPPLVALTDAQDQNDLDKISAQLAELESSAGVAISGAKQVMAININGKISELRGNITASDASISKVITGQVLAQSSGDKGSYALGKVHENSLNAIALGDFQALISKLSRTLCRWALELNGLDHLKARMVLDEEALKARQSSSASPSADSPMNLSHQPDDNLLLMV